MVYAYIYIYVRGSRNKQGMQEPPRREKEIWMYTPVVERRGAEEAVAVVGDEEAAVDVDLLRHELRARPERGAAVHAGVGAEAWGGGCVALRCVRGG